jgi:protease-4
MPERPGFFRRFLLGFWRLLDFSRRLVFNVLFMVIVVVVLIAWFTGDRPPRLLPDTALVLNLQGNLVEEYTVGPREAAIAEALGDERFETRLRDLIAALDTAATDPQITRAVLVLDEMGGAGQASLREVAAGLERFKASGKPVVAWGESFSQAQYYLAAHADELYMHPAGMLTVRGLGGPRAYYKNLLDKLGVRINVFQAGRYKSFAEPFTRTEASPEAKEADAYLLNGLWSVWTGDVERARGLPAGTINTVIEQLPQRLAEVGGDTAKLVLREKMIDGLMTRDEFRGTLFEAGAPRSEDDEETFRQVSVYSYVRNVRQPLTAEAVGVIVAQGEIVGGDARQQRVGSTSTSELIQRARQDDRIKAVVMRIDSPGGLMQASELIREQLDLTRQAGKPVVISMGDVAASGGYWIAMGGDEVLADATTITGSIGVFGLVPTFEGAAEKVGVTTDGVATTWVAGATDLTKPLDKRLEQVVGQVIGNHYRDFVALVAERRSATPEQINEVAQGRVWTGTQAMERGLVDRLGGLHDAIGRAAERASLGDTYRVEYIEHAPRGINRYLALLFGRIAAFARIEFGLEGPLHWLIGAPPRQVQRDLELLAKARAEPLTVFSYCFCDPRQSR